MIHITNKIYTKNSDTDIFDYAIRYYDTTRKKTPSNKI